ncbi:hypothetical protein QQ008_01740 [Fulvivirgaceae bacterium BMA10]|uniref:Outer membrane protein beta-barrel domain-containing protein n=1 Tax=Splendidivirga corallicola TaxID=3051826 RepID=A0ABT8KHY6_9BACT|nr:hypothetical protein [Fulvivirgaceae bacterium BMA10]
MKKLILILFLSSFCIHFGLAQETENDSIANAGNYLDEIVASRPTSVASEAFQKGDVLFSANFGLTHGKNEMQVNGATTAEVRSFDVWGTGQIGFFAVDKVAIGLSIDSDINYTDAASIETTEVGLFGAPFLRWHFLHKLYFQAKGGYGIQNTKVQDGENIVKTSFNGVYGAANFGYNFFITQHEDVAIDVGAGYTYKQLVDADNTNNKIIEGKFKYSVGITFYFW